MQANKNTATKVKINCQGWLNFSKSELAPILEERNRTLDETRKFSGLEKE